MECPRHQNHSPSIPLPVPPPPKKQCKSPLCHQPQGEGALVFDPKPLWILIHQTLEFGKKKGRTSVPKASEAPRRLSSSSPQGALGADPALTSAHMCTSPSGPRCLNSAGNDCPKARVEERREQNSSISEGTCSSSLQQASFPSPGL